MGARSLIRPLLCVIIIAVIASGDAAEANMFSNMMQKLMGKMRSNMQKMQDRLQQKMTEMKEKFSVLSSFFGKGKRRADFTLPQIFTGIFSRNNSFLLANGTSLNQDSALGNGASLIGAISNGGALSVSSNNGVISLGTGPRATATSSPSLTPSAAATATASPSNGAQVSASSSSSPSPSPERTAAGDLFGMNLTDDEVEEEVLELMSDWDAFLKSEIWKAQDEEVGEGEEKMATTSRVVNGVFLGSGLAAGAGFSVRFFYNNETNFYCSGSLIGYPFVLTAGHCGVVPGDEVRVGGRLLRSGVKARVEEVLTHPEFEADSLRHDVALVKLDGLPNKKELGKVGVQAAKLNRDNKFPKTGFMGIVSGHGSVEMDGRGVSDEVRSTRHEAYDIRKCQEEITQGNVSEDGSFLCGGDGNRSTTCVGDSGAGLWRFVSKKEDKKTVRYYEVYGIVSFGEVTDEALCPRGPPTVFQRTSSNYKWIRGVVGKKNLG